MILKYKLDNGRWKWVTLKNFSIDKLDITNIYNKYIDKDTGVIDYASLDGDIGYEIYSEFKALFQNAADYDIHHDAHNILYDKNIINKHMTYLVVSFEEGVSDSKKGESIIIYNEAYLMSDEGRTIEKLL
ncbi:MAG TPA: hypothetical protein GXZ90_03920 [Clostridiales bacterium]|nr:hypothetical protein [Clostridiales bacterium]